jgi:pimeloyl-ACP methyl ester carboxylesterase
MTVHPKHKKVRTKARLIGAGCVGVGLLGLVLPLIPGILFILLGLSILSAHSTRMHRLFARMRMRYPDAADRMERIESAIITTLGLTTHTHEYVHIPHPDGGDIHAVVNVAKHGDSTVAILLHSVRTTMEGRVQGAVADVLRAHGYTVVRFDAYNGLGESDGAFTNLTASRYRNDIDIVMAWVTEQPWWTGHAMLFGHSVGGLVASLYAIEHPEQVERLILLGPAISGTRYRQAEIARSKEAFDEWESTGIRTVRHPLLDEDFGLSFSFVRDLDSYDLEAQASALTMPIDILVGTDDLTCTPSDAKALASAIGPHARVHSLPHVPHIPASDQQLHTLQDALAHL